MSDYISREALLAEQRHLYCENCARRKNGKGKFVYDIGDAPCRACDIMDVLDAVEDFPAAAVRPVVTCAECKWWTKQEASLQGRCELLQMYPTGAWFCANGKREES